MILMGNRTGLMKEIEVGAGADLILSIKGAIIGLTTAVPGTHSKAVEADILGNWQNSRTWVSVIQTKI